MKIDIGILHRKYFEKIKKGEKGFLIAEDEKGNKITSYITNDEEVAKKILGTLINCENCIDSMNCTDCIGLVECENCYNCAYCMSITDKTNCKPFYG